MTTPTPESGVEQAPRIDLAGQIPPLAVPEPVSTHAGEASPRHGQKKGLFAILAIRRTRGGFIAMLWRKYQIHVTYRRLPERGNWLDEITGKLPDFPESSRPPPAKTEDKP
jgi:hypothetical protein